MGEREKWVDDVKVIACVLVVLGHFFQSMTKADILPENDLYGWFNATIYYFHVPLFFICSGYLYQKYSKLNGIGSWCRNVKKKVLVLGVPYVTFSTATWILKKAFSSSVNNQIGSLCDMLLFHPTSPYWYLYALFFIFLVTPTFNSRKTARVGLAIAAAARILDLNGGSVYAVAVVLSNEIWFVLGMSICAFDVSIKGRRIQGVISAAVFTIMSVVIYRTDFYSGVLSFAMGMIACIAVILIVSDLEGKFGKLGNSIEFLAQYTMPIFLMHTLFAAPMRATLLKIGIGNAAVHIVLGLGISFAGPIIAAWIMKKTRWLEFFLYPNKFIKTIR